jgi:multicomponent Na+:H+ antiporter subunit E
MIAPAVRRRIVHPVLIGWLTAVWVLLWSDLSLANVLAGLIIGTAVTTLLHLNPVPFRAHFNLRWSLILIGHFISDLVKASGQVAFLALRPGRVPRGAVIRVQLRSHSDVVLTMTAEITSLVPGSIVIEAHRLTGTLYVHLLDAEIVGGLEAARHHVFEQERRVLYALAAPEEIAEAGLPPAPGWRRDRATAAQGPPGRASSPGARP